MWKVDSFLGSDFRIDGGKFISFPSSDPFSPACLEILIIGDTMFEGDEDFIIEIVSSTPAIITGSPSFVVQTIVDSTGMP